MNLPTRLPRTALAASLLALSLGAGAQPAPPGQTSPSGQTAQTGASRGTAPAAEAARQRVSRSDRHFIQKAAGGGLAEVALGNMARERARDAQVRQFGERMVQDHTKANQELTTLAGTRGVGTPADSDRKHRRVMERLGKLQGAEFDRAYMEAMVEDHEDTVELFEEQSRDGDDAELKAFATKTLPALRDHLQQARALHERVKNAR